MATILTKKSDTSSAVPSSGDLTHGSGGAELAVNTADKRIFTKNSGGTVVELGTNPSSITTGTLSATGNVTLGDASTDTVTVNGYMGVGGAASSVASIFARSTALTGTNQYGVYAAPTGTSGATTSVNGVTTAPATADAVFTVAAVYGLRALNATKGAASTITNQHGIRIDDQTQGTNNYGITSQVSSGTNKWNIYASGTAANHFAGLVLINSTVNSGSGLKLQVGGSTVDSLNGIQFGKAAAAAQSTLPYIQQVSEQVPGTSNDLMLFAGGTGAGRVIINSNDFVVKTGGGTTPSGAERMRIDSSGNVGVGTSSPADKLDVNGKSTFRDNIRLPNTNYIYSYAGGTSTTVRSGMYLDGTNNLLALLTNDTERMRIDSSGNLLVGTTSATVGTSSGTFVVNFAGNAANGIKIRDSYSSAATNNAVVFIRNASEVGSITTTLSATAYNTSSDYRLKENVVPMTGALEKVSQLNPVTYTWKIDGSAGQGFIAHELAEVVPDCVTGEKDAVETYLDEEGNEQTRPVYQGIDTSFLVATLTAAIQEQQAIIESLKSRLDAAGL